MCVHVHMCACTYMLYTYVVIDRPIFCAFGLFKALGYSLNHSKSCFALSVVKKCLCLFKMIYLQIRTRQEPPYWVINAKPTYCRSRQTSV